MRHTHVVPTLQPRELTSGSKNAKESERVGQKPCPVILLLIHMGMLCARVGLAARQGHKFKLYRLWFQ